MDAGRANAAAMFDLRPVGYVIGLLVTMLGFAMLLPLVVDLGEGMGEVGGIWVEEKGRG